jgi:Calcineurin-like phosphoesterase
MRSINNLSKVLLLAFILLAKFNYTSQASAQTPNNSNPTTSGQQWQFAVSGDSRNCGDVVMPTIARSILRDDARFYWHLGDLRAIADFDEDIKLRAGAKTPTILDYENSAWQDFIENQINAFKVPFFLGIGNHETISPKSRNEFLTQFADWLNAPEIQQQRLKDNPNDHRLRAYYHWQQKGVDFIYLDNATTDQFDAAQLGWFKKVLDTDEADPTITTIVVGMHEALPDSLASDHSMSDYPAGVQSGRAVYERLLQAQNRGHKLVYILASHSHFFMEGIFNSEYWKAHGGEVPGWIVGTAGAVRYKLPPNAETLARKAKTNVYGYLLATVNPTGSPLGTIRFDFRELKEPDVPVDVQTKFGTELIHWCFEKNSNVPIDDVSKPLH